MAGSKVHKYRGYQVKISFGRSFPANLFSAGYLLINSVGMIVGHGLTPMVSNEELAEQLALSLASEAVDAEFKKIRSATRRARFKAGLIRLI